MELEGKVAVIAGAAQGIGEGLARRFVSEGCRVAGVDIQGEGLDALESELGNSFMGIQADLSSAEEIERVFSEAVARYGGVDILVNCAVVRSNIPFDACFRIPSLVVSSLITRRIFLDVSCRTACMPSSRPTLFASASSSVANCFLRTS